MEQKKVYHAPVLTRVRLDVKESVLGKCMMSPEPSPPPDCTNPDLGPCPTPPGLIPIP